VTTSDLRLVWDITTVEQNNGRWSAWCVLDAVLAPDGTATDPQHQGKPYIVRSRQSEEEAKQHLGALMALVTTKMGRA
jgi:hypothetical protein